MTRLRAGPATGGLAARIRDATAAAHREAEHTPFVQDLLAGRLDRRRYAALVAQHHAIYERLEAAVAAATDPDLAPFLVPELARLEAIEADLVFLAGTDWRDDLPSLPATRAYCDHLDRVTGEWPGGLLAHHYVRYLGDLSGGQLIGRVLQRIFDLDDERGTRFYRFPGITSPKAFKARYRDLLDGLPWDGEAQERLIAEVVTAYRLTTDVLYELGEVDER